MNQCAEVVESNLPTSKRCTKCNVDFPLTAFYKSKAHKDGFYPWCYTCKKVYTAQPHVRAASVLRATKWVIANPERRRITHTRCSAAWRAANPIASGKINRRAKEARRARLANVENTLTPQEWQDILLVFNNACAYCLAENVPLEQEHMQPISKGGAHSAHNIVPACVACNRKKSAKSLLQFISLPLQQLTAAA